LAIFRRHKKTAMAAVFLGWLNINSGCISLAAIALHALFNGVNILDARVLNLMGFDCIRGIVFIRHLDKTINNILDCFGF